MQGGLVWKDQFCPSVFINILSPWFIILPHPRSLQMWLGKKRGEAGRERVREGNQKHTAKLKIKDSLIAPKCLNLLLKISQPNKNKVR